MGKLAKSTREAIAEGAANRATKGYSMRKIKMTAWVVAVLTLSVWAQGAQPSGGTEPPLTAKQVFTAVKEAVVRVESDKGEGTGFFFSDGRHVVTCLHVIAGASQVTIRSTEGSTLWAPTRVRFDRATDIAVLELSEDSKRKPIPAGGSSGLSVGDPVYVVGNPLGFLAGSLSTGIVSGRRQIEKVSLVQTDAAISPGSSGSPMLDGKGKVVGVMGFFYEGGQNLNLAVAIEQVNRLIGGKYEPVSVLKAEAAEGGEAAPDKRTAAEKAADARGSEVFADYWGPMEEQFLIWMCELRTDRITSGVGSVTELARRTFNRALKMTETGLKKDAFLKFLEGKPKDEKASELIESIPAFTARFANSVAQFDYMATVGKGKDSEKVGDEMSAAIEALHGAIEALEMWAFEQPWFDVDAFSKRITPPVYAYTYGMLLSNVYPNALLKTGCFIGWVTDDESELKPGDRIKGVAKKSGGPFDKTEDWRVFLDKLYVIEGKPEFVYVEVERDGKSVVAKAKVNWPKDEE